MSVLGVLSVRLVETHEVDVVQGSTLNGLLTILKYMLCCIELKLK